jgi:hypothetical protein
MHVGIVGMYVWDPLTYTSNIITIIQFLYHNDSLTISFIFELNFFKRYLINDQKGRRIDLLQFIKNKKISSALLNNNEKVLNYL